jgi:adenylate cyclase
VIPVRNRSDDKAQDYFSDGISEDINTDLTKVASLAVTPTATMRRCKGKTLDLRDVSDRIRVRYILEGSVRRGTGRLRISAQLYDAKADKQVWAERYDRGVEDLFAVQDDIAEKVVTAISAKLTTGALTRQVRTYTPNVEAYDLYIRGSATRIARTPDNLAAASGFFEKAIGIDPKFAGGYAGASFTKILRYEHCSNSCEGLLDAALELANKAVSLDPTFGPGYGSLAEARFRRDELGEALSAVQKAVEVASNDFLMRASYGRILRYAGRHEEGIQQVKQALQMNPDSLPLLYYLGSIYRVAGRFEEAIDALREHRKRLGGRILPAPTAQTSCGLYAIRLGAGSSR